MATKLADEDRPRLAGARACRSSPRARRRTIGFRIENDGDHRHMAIDELGEPFTRADVRGWLAAALADVDWVHAGALTRADFPAETAGASSPAAGS